MAVDPVPAVRENFSGIERALWIEHPLDLSHHPEELRPELFLHVLGPRDADPMFRRERAFELPNESRRLVRNSSKFFEVAPFVKVQDRPDVEEARSGVSIEGRLKPERRHDRPKTGYVCRQLLGPHGGVFDKRDRLGRPDTAREQRQSGFAYGPDEIHFLRASQNYFAQA